MKNIFSGPYPSNKLLLLYFFVLCVSAFFCITTSVADDSEIILTPDVVGMTVSDAVQAFKEAGFTNNPIIETDTLVTAQNPLAGTEVSADEICTISTNTDKISGSGPVPNPFLASSLYAITHFDPSQSDSTPYGPPKGEFIIDTTTMPIVYAGPVNIITLASVNKDYMWGVSSSRVSYLYISEGKLTETAGYEALEDVTGGLVKAVPKENFQAFAQDTAVGMNTETMNTQLMELLGEEYAQMFGNGIYSVVDDENVLYTNFGSNLYAFALTDPENPAAGITPRYRINDIITAIQGTDHPEKVRLFGLSMTYDGRLIVTFSNGIAVINRDLDIATALFYQLADDEYVSNSIAVDENNGIYIASDKTMRKLVWTGTAISDAESDGAWSCPYTYSTQPPIIKVGIGTGSTPTLMGFGDDDRLVVITDGAQQMNLIAFWRDEIPEGYERIAGQVPVTCGFITLPDWIQSEQSVVVSGYGAFVVNNMPSTVPDDLIGKNNLLQVSLMGPAYETSYGVERFEWNTNTKEWSSVWNRPDVSSTSMVPIHSDSGNMAIVNGYRPINGWEIIGLDWDTGETIHQTIFGDLNGGNGAYAILQYLEDGDALFNSFAGPTRINYNTN
ncbi:PASTA domain-containing protein [Methanospirillum sp.]|uniref:PASTA domain-containing protein n=1 Tax=Methanospirillum sp. TaxID=45200 RepID=UPI0035A04CF9